MRSWAKALRLSDIHPNAADVNEVWLTYVDAHKEILDLSDLHSQDGIDENNLNDYLHFEQVDNDLKVSIDETENPTAETFNEAHVSNVAALHNTHLDATSYEDVMKGLIDSQQVILDT